MCLEFRYIRKLFNVFRYGVMLLLLLVVIVVSLALAWLGSAHFPSSPLVAFS